MLDEEDRVIGVITRRDMYRARAPEANTVRDLIHRPLAAIYPDQTLRDAADHMVRERVGRLPVVARTDPYMLIGILTRSDLVNAHARRLDEAMRTEEPWDIADGLLSVAEGVPGTRATARRRAMRMQRATGKKSKRRSRQKRRRSMRRR